MDSWKYDPSRRLFLKNLGIVTAGIPLLGSKAYAMLANRMMMGAAGTATWYFEDDCSSLTGWTDGDANGGESTQVTFDSQETFKFDSKGIPNPNVYAHRHRDIGSIEGLGNTVVVKLKLYCDAIGSGSSDDEFSLSIHRSDWRGFFNFQPDGLFVYDGAAWNEVGTNIVVQDSWQIWKFVVDFSSGVANADVDVYLGGALQQANVDCSSEEVETDGQIALTQYGISTADRISYSSYVKVGNADYD